MTREPSRSLTLHAAARRGVGPGAPRGAPGGLCFLHWSRIGQSVAKLAGSPRELLEPDVDSTPNMCHFACQTRLRLRRPAMAQRSYRAVNFGGFDARGAIWSEKAARARCHRVFGMITRSSQIRPNPEPATT